MNDFRKLLLAAGMIASPWLLVACGKTADSDDDGDSNSGRSGICRSICKRAEECDVASRNECVQACNDDNVSSSSALQVVEICADDVNCTGFEDGTLAECVTEGIAALDASTAAEDYCDDLTDWVIDCPGTSPSAAECYWTANAVSSAYLDEIHECLGEGCEDATACLESVEARYDVGDSIIQSAINGFGGGTNTECCSTGDPCGWADDGECDCSGDFAWDSSDCSSVEPGPNSCSSASDGVCDEPDLCPAGTDTADCDGTTVDCCSAGDPCGWAGEGTCDCGGELAWDANDCAVPGDDSCQYARDNICDEPEYCENGTDTTDCELEVACCVAGDPCGWANDTYCDCDSSFAWDAVDCDDSTVDCCATGDPCSYANDGVCDCGGDLTWDEADCGDTASNTCVDAYDDFCDEPNLCAYGTDSADCAGACCSATDPCGWASDDACDCQGAFAWDAVDCGL